MPQNHATKGQMHAEAANPETPTLRLEELAAISRLAPLVAANPNTSAEILLQLAYHYPQQVLGNPIIPLLLIEDPRFVARFDRMALLQFLRVESLPDWLQSYLAHHINDSIRTAFRYHISQSRGSDATFVDVQRAIQNDVIRTIRKIDVVSSHRPAEWLVETLAGHRDLDIREVIALRSDTPAHILEQLASDRYARIREAVAFNPVTSSSVLEHLAQDRFYKVRLAVAQHPQITSETLKQLGGDPSPEVRCAVIFHSQAMPETLATLAHDTDSGVQQALASRQQGDSPLLYWRLLHPAWNSLSAANVVAQEDHPEKMSDDPQEKILHYFRQNGWQDEHDLAFMLALSFPFIPGNILARNATSPFWDERYIIARHPNADQTTLDLLAHDGNRFVREAAQVRLRT